MLWASCPRKAQGGYFLKARRWALCVVEKCCCWGGTRIKWWKNRLWCVCVRHRPLRPHRHQQPKNSLARERKDRRKKRLLDDVSVLVRGAAGDVDDGAAAVTPAEGCGSVCSGAAGSVSGFCSPEGTERWALPPLPTAPGSAVTRRSSVANRLCRSCLTASSPSSFWRRSCSASLKPCCSPCCGSPSGCGGGCCCCGGGGGGGSGCSCDCGSGIDDGSGLL